MLENKWIQVLLMVMAIALVLGILPFWKDCSTEKCRKVNTWEKLLIYTGSVRAD